MVPYGWIIEPKKTVGIADNIVKLFKNSKETRIRELTTCNKSLGEVDIRRELFQWTFVSLLLFVVVLIPLSIILNETNLGYVASRNQKLNYLFFKEDLKIYAKSERKLDWLIQTVKIFSNDIGMVFGLDKCAVRCWS